MSYTTGQLLEAYHQGLVNSEKIFKTEPTARIEQFIMDLHYVRSAIEIHMFKHNGELVDNYHKQINFHTADFWQVDNYYKEEFNIGR